MDIVWIVLDSLAYSASPFGDYGPNTMPNLERIARQKGIIYTDAYVPGPSSPSSHGSFFTGYLPSETGMNEANPYFPGNHETIAEILSDTHESFAITANKFVHNGLSDTFDHKHQIPVDNWEIFDDDAASIVSYIEGTKERQSGNALNFVLNDGKPFRSLINGINYKVRQKINSLGRGPSRNATRSWAPYICNKIESYVVDNKNDILAVANFMDTHPPFEPSDQALEKFISNTPRSELPINVSGESILDRVQEEESYNADNMFDLLKATAWDVDRYLGPMIRRLLKNDVFVAVTADHGIWFRRERELDNERIHVPLVIFAPNESPRTVDHTVNLIDLPETTIQSAVGESGQFPGENLFDVSHDRISITEFIHTDNSGGKKINIHGIEEKSVIREVAGISGDGHIEYTDGEFHVLSGNDELTSMVKECIDELLKHEPRTGSGDRIEYEEAAKQQLRDFGYL